MIPRCLALLLLASSLAGAEPTNGTDGGRIWGPPAVAPRSCRRPFPSELLNIRFQHHGSFWAKKAENRANPLQHDGNGHAFLPVRALPAGHRVGFVPLAGRSSSHSIGWSPRLGLEYPQGCHWAIWIATEDDPMPGCNCWTGPVSAHPDRPVSLVHYVTPLRGRPAGDVPAKLKERSCVLEGGRKYFLYFAAFGDDTAKRCSAMLFQQGDIGSE